MTVQALQCSEVRCDVDDCEASHRFLGDATGAITNARRKGWSAIRTSHGRQDYCPEHRGVRDTRARRLGLGPSES